MRRNKVDISPVPHVRARRAVLCVTYKDLPINSVANCEHTICTTSYHLFHVSGTRPLIRDGNLATAWTKEEQLLGYTTHQRQRIKALQTLGLTDEAFEKCRAIMLSSLGPSAFGFGIEETAVTLMKAADEDGGVAPVTTGWRSEGERLRRTGLDVQALSGLSAPGVHHHP